MKKIILYFFVLAAAVACNTVEVDDNHFPGGKESVSGMITEIISGRHGSSTKATIADEDATFAWTEGDNIAVHVSNGTSGKGKYVFTSDRGATGAHVDATNHDEATFKVVYETGYSRDAFAVYPSNIVDTSAANYGQSGSPLDVKLPSSYTLSQVSGVTSPCPMISDNTGTGWDFYQLCGLLRLTVNNISSSAKRLEITFDGKNVAGYFYISNPIVVGTSKIEMENASGSNSSTITITKGTDETFGGDPLVLNIPLPVGTYTDFTVTAYDADDNPVSVGTKDFTYPDFTKGIKESTSLSPQSFFTFTFSNNGTALTNIRFVRNFSSQNKLHNDVSTYGPFTIASETDLTNPIHTILNFASNPDDQLVFQVVTADGKVYSGSKAAPSTGYEEGKSYSIPVTVNLYRFTVSTSTVVCFSPGDLGVDNGVYSFTEPFTSWGHGEKSPNVTKRVWFDYSEVNHTDNETTGHSIYGIKWRIQKSLSSNASIYTPHEWDNIIGRQFNNDNNNNVKSYYRVSIPGHQYCLLLPPDETQNGDIGEDLTSGIVTDYLKYIAKGFVLLMNTGEALYWNGELIWYSSENGWYWALWNNMSTNRTFFSWDSSNTPVVSHFANQARVHARYMHDVEGAPMNFQSRGSSGILVNQFNGFTFINGNEEQHTW